MPRFVPPQTQHIQQYKASWEEGAKQWTAMAKEKVAELKLGAEILAGATSTAAHAGTTSSDS